MRGGAAAAARGGAWGAMHLLAASHGAHRSLSLAALAHSLTRPAFPPPHCHVPRFSRHLAASTTPSAPRPYSTSHLQPHRCKWFNHGRSARLPWRAWSATTTATTDDDEERVDEPERWGGPEAPHVAVLLKQVVAQFAGRPVLSFVDCTLGAAGHASAVSLLTRPVVFLHFRFVAAMAMWFWNSF